MYVRYLMLNMYGTLTVDMYWIMFHNSLILVNKSFLLIFSSSAVIYIQTIKSPKVFSFFYKERK